MALPGSVIADDRALLRDQVISAQRRSHVFFVALTLLLIGTVVTGFWPSFFGTLLSGGVSRPLVMNVHGTIFTGWMLLLFVQVGLASSGRLRGRDLPAQAGDSQAVDRRRWRSLSCACH